MMRRQMVGPVELPRISRNNKSSGILVVVEVFYPSLCKWRTKQNDMRDWPDVPRVRPNKSAKSLGEILEIKDEYNSEIIARPDQRILLHARTHPGILKYTTRKRYNDKRSNASQNEGVTMTR
jgi:hypothetical protein